MTEFDGLENDGGQSRYRISGSVIFQSLSFPNRLLSRQGLAFSALPIQRIRGSWRSRAVQIRARSQYWYWVGAIQQQWNYLVYEDYVCNVYYIGLALRITRLINCRYTMFTEQSKFAPDSQCGQQQDYNYFCPDGLAVETQAQYCLVSISGRVEYLWHHACTQCPCEYSDKKLT